MRILIIATLVSVSGLFVAARAADPPPAANSFVFEGTVQSVGTLASLDAGAPPETVIVRIDKPIRSRAGAVIPAGTIVRVRLDTATPVKAGDKRRFRTDALTYGNVITLHGTAAPLPAPGGLSSVPEEPEAPPTPTIEEKVKSADLIISGVVKSVHPLARQRRTALAAIPRQRAISEHDGDWQEADIEVKSVAKGDLSVKTVTVIFPASEDRQWFKDPKFRENDAKVFFLHKDQIRDPDVRGALLMSVTEPAPPSGHGGAYTATDAVDVQDAATFTAVRKVAKNQ